MINFLLGTFFGPPLLLVLVVLFIEGGGLLVALTKKGLGLR